MYESLALCSLSEKSWTNKFVARVTENLSNSHGTADVVQIGVGLLTYIKSIIYSMMIARNHKAVRYRFRLNR